MRALPLVRRAAGRLRARPVLLVAGLSVAVADVAALASVLGVSFVVGPHNGYLALLLWPLGHGLVAALLVPAVLPGLYALAREGPRPFASPGSDGGVADLRAAVTANVRGFVPVLVAGGLARGLAALGALLLLPLVVGVGLAVATPLSAGLSAAGLVRTPSPQWYLLGLVGLAWLTWSAAQAPVAFADLLALDGTSPRAAWRVSARRTLARPRRLAAYTLTRWALVAAPVVLASVTVAVLPVATTNPHWYLVFAPAVVLGKALEGSFHTRAAADWELTDPVPRTAPAGESPSGRPAVPSARTVAALGLVLALVLGAGAVRVADWRPAPEPGGPPALTDGADAAATYERAVERTRAASRTVDWEFREYDGSDTRLRARSSLVVDYGSRQLLAERFREGDGGGLDPTTTVYASDGRVVSNVPIGPGHEYTIHETRAGPWLDRATPGFVKYADATVQSLPRPEGNWTVRQRTAESVVVGIDAEPNGTSASHFLGPSREADERLTDRNATVVVDRATGRLERLVLQRTLRRYASANRTTVTATLEQSWVATWRYDAAAVRPPASTGAGHWGLAWDVLYY